jgi:hypothetical protein
MTTTMREVLGSVFFGSDDETTTTPYQVEFRIDVLDSWSVSELAPVAPSSLTHNCVEDALVAS